MSSSYPFDCSSIGSSSEPNSILMSGYELISLEISLLCCNLNKDKLYLAASINCLLIVLVFCLRRVLGEILFIFYCWEIEKYLKESIL